MKFLTEYRDADLANNHLAKIREITTKKWRIMEFCGGQTHSLVKNGIINLLPEQIELIHGPGCPVCVTPTSVIDQAITLSKNKNIILCSFGDMLRVPGSKASLLQAKANGADIRFLYSPMDAVQLAKDNPDREIVFLAVGFETTAPANALSIIHADLYGLKNYSVLTSQVLVPPAMQTILEEEDGYVDGLLGAGHVCSVMGLSAYEVICQDYNVPIVVTGFEVVDLLQGILMLVQQLENKEARLENQYSRVVPKEGNPVAQQMIEQVFEICDKEWRGIGILPRSGWQLKEEMAAYDASKKFHIPEPEVLIETECIAGEVLKGAKKPNDCPHFGTKCTPVNPIGAPMVSSEGACAAYFHFANLNK
ncbi:MAG: hydrogenase formation protein HypD [Bacteroidota bacterium]